MFRTALKEMGISPTFELLCIILLGLGQMCIMTGYDTQSFIAESVLHAVNGREPTRIDTYAGYYGQATCYASYMIACLFAPSVLTALSPKWTLFVGSVCFTIYQIGFLYLQKYYYYASCVVMGIGFALYYAGHGAYLTSHSTRKSIERNSAIAWSIACLCMVVGSGILTIIFSLNINSDRSMSSSSNSTESIVDGHRNGHEHAYRQFSDTEIRMMYGTFTAVTILSNIIFATAPSSDIANCIEGKSSMAQKTFHKEMAMIWTTVIDKRMITLMPLFFHLGFFTSFWISVYPTSLIFTKSLSDHIYLPAFYSLAIGIGEVAMGILISTMSKRFANFGLKPTMFIAFGLTTVLLCTVLLSVPPRATTEFTDDPTWLIEPSAALSTFAALLIGIADSGVNNVRNVICALALPDGRAQAFAISKFYQASAGAMLMFLSPFFSIVHYAALLFFTLSLSTACFVHVAGQTIKLERLSSKKNLTITEESVEKF
ncbi:hypothetical protein DICVIV_10860 [Dictyocaulus viviparus]|uniref:Transporter, major facilitator family protein n=1 Tax=Dictyocaulus viviparus TaxID=29172 RepID=A0A0D8XHB3_DICVI|nr:hypothetical protein DICVIV_10860 [Dictyocaulus viviparus]